jgi:hypothetical protein
VSINFTYFQDAFTRSGFIESAFSLRFVLARGRLRVEGGLSQLVTLGFTVANGVFIVVPAGGVIWRGRGKICRSIWLFRTPEIPLHRLFPAPKSGYDKNGRLLRGLGVLEFSAGTSLVFSWKDFFLEIALQFPSISVL